MSTATKDGAGPTPSGAAGRFPAWPAWFIWAGMTLAALGFVGRYGFTVPFMDEWEWMPQASGAEPVTPAWLWSQHAEHRMVLPRLIYLGLGRLTGFNFRAGAIYNVLLLSGLSAVLMLTAKRLRGRASLCDAFFPLALLHWAQFINIAWGFQLNFVTSVVLSGLLLPAIMRAGARLSLGAAAAATLCLLGLGLCGGFGMPFLPPIALWIASAGLFRLREAAPRARWEGLVLLVLAALPALLTAAVFYGLKRPWPSSPGLWPSLRTSLQVLASSMGPAAREAWPVSGVLTLVMVAGTLWLTVQTLLRRSPMRWTAWGGICYLGGVAILAAGIGFGRAFVGAEAGFTDRYMTLTIPLLLVCYLLWETTGALPLARFQPSVRRACFALLCALVFVNAHKGLRWGADAKSLDAAITADMRRGLPIEALAVRYLDHTDFSDVPTFSGRLNLLRQAGLGPYRQSPAILDDVAVRPFVGDRYVRYPVRRVAVTRQESYTQPFRIAAAGTLLRIDLQLQHFGKRDAIRRLDWTLAETSPTGACVRRAQGQVDLGQLGYYDFAALVIPPQEVAAGQTWTLTLAAPADARPHDRCEFPLFASNDAQGRPAGSGLRAFTLTAQSPRSAAVLARSLAPSSEVQGGLLR